jgi:WD40 repeat protein
MDTNQSKLFQIRWIRVIGIPLLGFTTLIVWIVVINPILFGEEENLMDIGSVRQILQLDTETNILDLAWRPDSTLLAFLDKNYTISVVNVETGAIEAQSDIDEDGTTIVSSLNWDSLGDNLLVVSSQTEVWDYQDGELNATTRTIATEYVSEGVVGWSPSQNLIATGWQDGSVIIWNVHNSSERLELPAHEEIVNDIGWSPDGSMLATVGQDGKLFIWDVIALHSSGG